MQSYTAKLDVILILPKTSKNYHVLYISNVPSYLIKRTYHSTILEGDHLNENFGKLSSFNWAFIQIKSANDVY